MDRHNEESDTDSTIEIPKLPGTRTFSIEVFDTEDTRLLAMSELPKTFGSSRKADVRVVDPAVSGMHCELLVTGDRLRIRDLGSRNGTFVGAARVQEAWAGVGSTITLGETRIVVHAYEEIRGAPPGEPLPSLVGTSLVMRRLAARVRKLASLSSPVLIMGETGTGKELVAQALHDEGRRQTGPFVVLNVACLPRDWVESELFGHERGSFTGAVARRSGAFADAEKGTLFLDEIGELPLDAQPKLLRALDGYAIKRVGSSGSGERADVRVVAATHKPLVEDVAEQRFRRDLFHRLEAFVIDIPPLRKRRGDIVLIAQHILRSHEPELGPRVLSPGAAARLSSHEWEGNVRELRNVLLRASEANEGTVIGEACIAQGIRISGQVEAPDVSPAFANALLVKNKGNLTAAAREAGLPRTTFRKIVGRK